MNSTESVSVLANPARGEAPGLEDHIQMTRLLIGWEELQARLRAQEAELSTAIDEYRFDIGPMPVGMAEEVARLRDQCALHQRALFAAADGF